MRSVGLDLGARKISYCEVVNGGVFLRTTVSSVSGLVRLLGPQSPPARVAIEACRESWAVHATLSEWGHEVLVVDTTRSRQLGIGQHGKKTDKIDAEVLARAVEQGRIPLAHVLSPARRELRAHLSVRRTLVETRAQYVTTIRGLIRGQLGGQGVGTCQTEHFVAKLASATLDEGTRELVAPLVQALVVVDEQIRTTDRKLEALCAREPVVLLLATAPGVGRLVAAAFVSVIDEAKRFRRADQVGAYLGLAPSEDTTGGKRRIGSITKKGNAYMRALLIESAQSILRLKDPDDPLRGWGQAVAERRGQRIAVVALARRLACVLWAMWRDGTVYEPARLATKVARGWKEQAQSIELRAAALERAAKKTRPRGRMRNSARQEGHRID